MGDTTKQTLFRYRYLILATLTLCYMCQWIDRVATPTLMPFIAKDLGMDARHIGLSIAIMMLFYGPSQWLTGWLCDRVGSKIMLLCSLVLWGLLNSWTAQIHGVSAWFVRMALFGLFVGTEFVPSVRLLMRWFPAKQRATAQSIFSFAWILTPAWAPLFATWMFVTLGGWAAKSAQSTSIFAPLINGWVNLGQGNGWRMEYIFFACASVLPLLLILLLIVDRPEKCRFASRGEIAEAYQDEIHKGLISAADIQAGKLDGLEAKAKAGNISFRKFLVTPGFLPAVAVIVVAQQLIWGVLTWSSNYLFDVHHFKVMTMGAWACVYFVGGALGSFLSSRISDTLLGGRRRPMIFLCFGGVIPFIIVLATLKIGVPAYVLLLTLTGAGFFSNMVWGPALSIPADLFSAEVYGKAIGFTNCIGYMLAAACPSIMGLLIRTDPVTHVVSYFWAWLYIALAALCGIVAACFLVDRKVVR